MADKQHLLIELRALAKKFPRDDHRDTWPAVDCAIAFGDLDALADVGGPDRAALVGAAQNYRLMWCPECRELHDAPWSAGSWPCSRMTADDWAMYCATEYVEQVLAESVGQYHHARERMIENVAWDVNEWARRYPWGERVQRKFLSDKKLAASIKRRLEQPPEPIKLTEAQARLVTDKRCLDMISRYAWAKVRTITLGGRRVAQSWAKYIQTEIVAELEVVGLLAAQKAALRFDPKRGAQFTTFASRRVDGAMRDYLKTRIPTEQAAIVSKDGGAQEHDLGYRQLFNQWQAQAHSTADVEPDEQSIMWGASGDRRRPSAGYLATQGRHTAGSWRHIPSNPRRAADTRRRALSKLSPVERAVRIGRDSEPPVPVSKLAGKLGKSERQIRRIDRKSSKKLHGLLSIYQ